MTTITYQAMPPGFPVTRADRVVRIIIPVFAIIGLVLLFGFYLPEAEDRRILAAIVFLLGFPFLAGGLQFAQRNMAKSAPPVSGALLLDDEGLTWRHTRWPWRELSAFEVCDLGPERRFICFHVPEDPQSSKSYRRRTRVAPGRSERRITGHFDAPLADIAATLNDMRRRTLDDAAEGKAAPPLPAAGPEGTARVFFVDAERSGHIGTWNVLFYLFVVAVVTWPDIPNWIAWAIFAIFVVLFIRMIVGEYFPLTASRVPAPADNFLALDDDGLTVTRHGRTTTWSWRETSPFRARAAGPIGRALGCGVIVATVPDDSRLSRFWRLAGRLLFRRPALVIADTYLGRPEDIAATLNEYRDRALGGGTPTSEPSVAG